MVWSVNDPRGQQQFAPGKMIASFNKDVTTAEAVQITLGQLGAIDMKIDVASAEWQKGLIVAQFTVADGKEDEVLEALKLAPGIQEVSSILKPIFMGGPITPAPCGAMPPGGAERIEVTDTPQRKIDHEWLAKQLGAEIVEKVEGPIHGMAGVENLTRIYQRRMKELRDAEDANKGDKRRSDGGGSGGTEGGESTGN
jgi:hypothetical protein